MLISRKPLQTLLLAGMLASVGLAAVAQTPPPPPASHGQGGPGFHHRDPAKMQERAAKRLAELKTALRITSAQEGAWQKFAAAMTPQPKQRPPFDRDAFAKLTTPERIDRLQQLRAERNAKMDQRAAATKTFYTSLNTDQKKTFDDASLKFLHRGGKHHHGGHGGPQKG